LSREGAPEVDGLVLVSPAVWGWSNLNPFYRMSLWIAAHTFPGGTLTGSSVKITPSDNIEMLRDNFNDELFIKKTRTDAIYGLVTLMEEGYSSADGIDVPTLLLYGEKDEIIPRKPVESVVARLNGDSRVVLYQNGYHMLLRDLQAETVWADIRAWLVDPKAEMPSGEELAAGETLAQRLSRN
jgi:alpha-beta hydrolase superfamily lysophospholipase